MQFFGVEYRSCNGLHAALREALAYLPACGKKMFNETSNFFHLPTSRRTAATEASPAAGETTATAGKPASAATEATSTPTTSAALDQRKKERNQTENYGKYHSYAQQHAEKTDQASVNQCTRKGAEDTSQYSAADQGNNNQEDEVALYAGLPIRSYYAQFT